jgi:hypothetical protein
MSRSLSSGAHSRDPFAHAGYTLSRYFVVRQCASGAEFIAAGLFSSITSRLRLT